MKLPFRIIVPLLAGLAGPAAAADQVPSPSLAELGHSFRNALTEEETHLLIEYMRDSVLAAFNDEEVTLPPDLAFKLEVLQQRLKQESNFYLDNFLKQLEADIRRSLKEKMEASQPLPYTPPEVPLLRPAMMAPPPATPPATTAAATIPVAPPPAAKPPAAAYQPPPTQFNPPPWGYVPWFYQPWPTYQARPIVPPWLAPPLPLDTNKAK